MAVLVSAPASASVPALVSACAPSHALASAATPAVALPAAPDLRPLLLENPPKNVECLTLHHPQTMPILSCP